MAADRQIEDKGKGKGKEKESQDGQGGEDGEGKQQMKEVRRPPPLPAVKGTIGAIGPCPSSCVLLSRSSPGLGKSDRVESPSRRSFYATSPTSSTTVSRHDKSVQRREGQRELSRALQIRGHTPSASYDHNAQQSPYPASNGRASEGGQDAPNDFRQRDIPVFRVDHSMTSCFDRLKLEKKEEIRSLFGA